jgi:hypothetical protein
MRTWLGIHVLNLLLVFCRLNINYYSHPTSQKSKIFKCRSNVTVYTITISKLPVSYFRISISYDEFNVSL